MSLDSRVAVFRASPMSLLQNELGKSAASIMKLAGVHSVAFCHFTNPFCCGVLDAVYYT
jgi:hypothetical protein